MQQSLHQREISHFALLQEVPSSISGLHGRLDSFMRDSEEFMEFIWVSLDSRDSEEFMEIIWVSLDSIVKKSNGSRRTELLSSLVHMLFC